MLIIAVPESDFGTLLKPAGLGTYACRIACSR